MKRAAKRKTSGVVRGARDRPCLRWHNGIYELIERLDRERRTAARERPGGDWFYALVRDGLRGVGPYREPRIAYTRDTRRAIERLQAPLETRFTVIGSGGGSGTVARRPAVLEIVDCV